LLDSLLQESRKNAFAASLGRQTGKERNS